MINRADIPEGQESMNSQRDESGEVHQRITIPVIEEQVHIDKKVVETAKVRISKSVSEESQTIDIPLTQEEVQVERVPINQYVDAAPPPLRYEGNTMVIPILKEVVVVEKKLMLVEEVRVTRKVTQTKDTQQISLRKEEIKVERTQKEGTPDSEI